MSKKITSALISVYYKDGLEPLVRELKNHNVTIYSTGGTQNFIENLGIEVVPVEDLTSYPSILGGRVKTLHPSVFGGILGRRNHDQDLLEMKEFEIPVIDLVVVDLYPFQETVASTSDEKQIIEKIDIGGPSMIRAAAKNFNDVAVIASRDDYHQLVTLLRQQDGGLTTEQRKSFAARAFSIVADYDVAIHNYFHPGNEMPLIGGGQQTVLRYGENPHQKAIFNGDMAACFSQLHGKEISYNNLVDIDAAVELIREFDATTFGFGFTPTIGVGGFFMAFDMNFTWSDINELDKPAYAFIFGPRIGKNIPFKKPERSLAVWAGGYRVKLNTGTQGSLTVSDLFPTDKWEARIDTGYMKLEETQQHADDWWNSLSNGEQNKPGNKARYELINSALARFGGVLDGASQAIGNLDNTTVQYSLDKKPKDMWNFLVGAQFQINRKWMIRAEYGFLTSRQQFIGGLQYRFGL